MKYQIVKLNNSKYEVYRQFHDGWEWDCVSSHYFLCFAKRYVKKLLKKYEAIQYKKCGEKINKVIEEFEV